MTDPNPGQAFLRDVDIPTMAAHVGKGVPAVAAWRSYFHRSYSCGARSVKPRLNPSRARLSTLFAALVQRGLDSIVPSSPGQNEPMMTFLREGLMQAVRSAAPEAQSVGSLRGENLDDGMSFSSATSSQPDRHSTVYRAGRCRWQIVLRDISRYRQASNHAGWLLTALAERAWPSAYLWTPTGAPWALPRSLWIGVSWELIVTSNHGHARLATPNRSSDELDEDPCLLGLYRRAAPIAKRRLRTTGPRAPD